MLTLEFETTDRDQLIARIKEFVLAIPSDAILNKHSPLMGVINSNFNGCGKSIIWDIFTTTLLIEKSLEEDFSHSYLHGDENLLGPEEELDMEAILGRQAEIWYGDHKDTGAPLRLHYYNAIDLTPFFENNMNNDINKTHDPRVSHEYLPNVILMNNRKRGPTGFVVDMTQKPTLERSLISASWQLKTKITIYDERLINSDALQKLAKQQGMRLC